MTPAQLRKRADAEDERGLAAVERGDRAEALAAFSRAETLRLVADEMEHSPLPPRAETRRVQSEDMLSAQHKVALSRSRTVRDHKFMEHIRGKGYSQGSLADAVGMSASSLSQARRRKSDPLFRRIPADKAAAIEKLTGWPASDWP